MGLIKSLLSYLISVMHSFWIKVNFLKKIKINFEQLCLKTFLLCRLLTSSKKLKIHVSVRFVHLFLWTFLLWQQPNRRWDHTAQLDEWHQHTEPHFLTQVLIKFILLSVTFLEKQSQLAQQMMGCLIDKEIRFLSLLFQQNIFLLNRKTECEIMYHCSHCKLHCMG